MTRSYPDLPRMMADLAKTLADARLVAIARQRYPTWEALLDDLASQAASFGRRVLQIDGGGDETLARQGEGLCTGWWLAMSWLSVRRDIVEQDQVCLPEDVASRHGLNLGLLITAVRADAAAGDDCGCVDVPTAGISALLPAYRTTMRDLVDRTGPMLMAGRRLWPMLTGEPRRNVKQMTLDAEAVLQAIRRRSYDTLSGQPIPNMLDRARARLVRRVW